MYGILAPEGPTTDPYPWLVDSSPYLSTLFSSDPF
jgi:hypothetical protein